MYLAVGLAQVGVVDEVPLLDHLLRALELMAAQRLAPASERLPLTKPMNDEVFAENILMCAPPCKSPDVDHLLVDACISYPPW